MAYQACHNRLKGNSTSAAQIAQQAEWPWPQDFVVLLSPYAPHVAEELWEQLGHTGTLAYHPWPVHDPTLLVQTTVNLPVQARCHRPHGRGLHVLPRSRVQRTLYTI